MKIPISINWYLLFTDINCRMSVHGYPFLDINMDIRTWMDNWRLSSKNYVYSCWYPWIFGNSCMDMLRISGTTAYVLQTFGYIRYIRKPWHNSLVQATVKRRTSLIRSPVLAVNSCDQRSMIRQDILPPFFKCWYIFSNLPPRFCIKLWSRAGVSCNSGTILSIILDPVLAVNLCD